MQPPPQHSTIGAAGGVAVKEESREITASPQSTSLRPLTFSRTPFLRSLTVAAVSSLRPARVSAASVEVAHITPSWVEDANHFAQLPLLTELVERYRVQHASQQEARLMSMTDVINDLGGPDAVEALLSQLENAANSTDAGQNSKSFKEVVEALVKQALKIMRRPRGDPEEFSVTEAEIGETISGHLTDEAVDISLLLGSPSPAVEHDDEVDVQQSAPTKEQGGYRAYAVLRVQRRRGVLALHIINLRFDSKYRHSTGERCRSDRVEPASGLPDRQPREGKGLRSRHAKRAAAAHHNSDAVAPASSSQALAPSASSTSTSSPPEITAEAQQLPSAVKVNALTTTTPLSANQPPILSPHRALKAVRQQRLTQPTLKDKLKRRPMKTAAALPRPVPNGERVCFDPLRPEETTPFSPANRPVTYNATMALQRSV